MIRPYNYSRISVGVDHQCIPVFDLALHEVQTQGLSYFTTFVHFNFEPPDKTTVPPGFCTDAFTHRNIEATMSSDNWQKYVVAKLTTDLGRPGHYHRTHIMINHLVKTLHYFKQFPFKAAIIPLRYADTTDLGYVLRTMSNACNPLPVWIKIVIQNIPEERVNWYMRKVMYEKLNTEQEKKNKEYEEENRNDQAAKYNENKVNNDTDKADIEKKENDKCDMEPEKDLKTEAQREYDNEIWEWWSRLHERTLFSKNIKVVLEFVDRVPDDYLIERWKSEPVAAIAVPTHIFYEKRGYPVLSHIWQHYLTTMMHYTKCSVMISIPLIGIQRHSIGHYRDYLQGIWDNMQQRYGLTQFEKNLHLEQWMMDTVKLPPKQLFHRSMEENNVRKMKRFYNSAFTQILVDKREDIALKKVAQLQSEPPTADHNFNTGIIIRIAVISSNYTLLVNQLISASTYTNIKIKIFVFERDVDNNETGEELKWPEEKVLIFKHLDPKRKLTSKCHVAIFDVLGAWGDDQSISDIIYDPSGILREDCTLVPHQYLSTVTPISSSSIWSAAKTARTVDCLDAINGSNLIQVWETYMRNGIELGEAKSIFSRNQSDPFDDDAVTPPQEPGNAATAPQEPGNAATPPQESGKAATSLQEPGNAATPPQEAGNSAIPPQEPGNATTPPQEPGNAATPPQESGNAAIPPQEPGKTATLPQEPGIAATPPQKSGNAATPPQEPGIAATLPKETGNAAIPPQESVNATTPPQEPGKAATPPQEPGNAATPPQEPDNTTTPPQEPGNTTTPPQESGNASTPPQEPGNTATPPQEPGNAAMPPQEPGNEATPPQEPGNAARPPQEPGKAPTPPQESGNAPTPPQKADNAATPPKEAGNAATPPQESGNTEKKVEDAYKIILTWTSKTNCVLHGFLGKFSCKLTVPSKMTVEDEEENEQIMPITREYSHHWMPLFIPLKYPIRLHKGKEVTVTFTRLDSTSEDEPKVWYGWQVTSEEHVSPEYNFKGNTTVLRDLFEPF